MQCRYAAQKKILEGDQPLAYGLRKTAGTALAAMLHRALQSGSLKQGNSSTVQSINAWYGARDTRAA